MTNFKVVISETAVKQFNKLEKNAQKRIKKGLSFLKNNPFKRRPGADIKKLKGFSPALYRLRIGKYRIIYATNKVVKITEIFRRGKGYA
ncbi:type II toxin-antitoxin system RelE/ParE family toxin, partial [Candidatus Woesearchaeota archaeon]|nr:type II toxin-antitoxin system RelE/ParE family toxin [Candidatus Woesearchaeota archaeon]